MQEITNRSSTVIASAQYDSDGWLGHHDDELAIAIKVMVVRHVMISSAKAAFSQGIHDSIIIVVIKAMIAMMAII